MRRILGMSVKFKIGRIIFPWEHWEFNDLGTPKLKYYEHFINLHTLSRASHHSGLPMGLQMITWSELGVI